MYTVRETLSIAEQLGVAVWTQSPASLARLFAAHAGQFYDRDRFDTLARTTRDLYAHKSDEAAACFCRRLDRRLRERNDAPIVWDRRDR